MPETSSTRWFTNALWLTWLLCGVLLQPSGDGLALTRDEQNTISVYRQVSASVVNITTTALQYDFFFNPIPTAGSGSGIILREDGTIVTNYHVIAGARNIEVTLEDGSRWKARVIGSAPNDDLAIIQIEARDRTLKPIALGDSDSLEIGEKVLAIGNPFGLGQTLTVGVVSMLGRDVRNGGRVFRNLIQTDASINPGNSGGALVNSKGELVGINTAILSPTGSSVGIGFAIPVNRMKQVVPGLTRVWGPRLGWLLAILLVYWIIRRITRPR